MVGTDLPYFPVGGPVPNLPKHLIKNANTWGGMEIGANQMYSTQVVDGHVSELGGHTMKKALQALPVLDTSDYRCFVSSLQQLKVYNTSTSQLDALQGDGWTYTIEAL